MAENKQQCCEKFKTMIGGQALIEGIMMRGPDKDAIVVRRAEGLSIETMPRKQNPPKSWKNLPFIRGVFNFFDAQVVGIKALLRSADLAPEEMQEEPSKFDRWLEEKLGNEKFQQAVVGIAVAMGLGLSILLFFLLPMVIGGFFDRWLDSNLALNLVEGIIRMVIFLAYMFLVSRMQEMKRVFSYHGAEHKTIRCYEAGLPLTVENVRMIAFKLLLLPIVVGITYEINRWAGRHDNGFTKILTAPGMWLQNFTTNEPDDNMIEVGIAAVEAVLPEQEGADRW